MQKKKTADELLKESDIHFKEAVEHIKEEEQEMLDKIDETEKVLTKFSKEHYLGL